MVSESEISCLSPVPHLLLGAHPAFLCKEKAHILSSVSCEGPDARSKISRRSWVQDSWAKQEQVGGARERSSELLVAALPTLTTPTLASILHPPILPSSLKSWKGSSLPDLGQSVSQSVSQSVNQCHF